MITTKFLITTHAKRPRNDNSNGNMKRATIKMKTHLNFVSNIPSHLKCKKWPGNFHGVEFMRTAPKRRERKDKSSSSSDLSLS